MPQDTPLRNILSKISKMKIIQFSQKGKKKSCPHKTHIPTKNADYWGCIGISDDLDKIKIC